MKKAILIIAVLTSLITVQAQETSTSTSRKGIHLGAHFTPGFGTIVTEAYENLAADYGMTAGLDMNFYFNNTMGIQTGIAYFNQPWRYKFFEDIAGGNYSREISANVESIGIPVKFLLTTGQKMLGFYLEAGLAFYFPVNYRSDRDNVILKTSNVMFATELAAGMNLKASDKLNFQMAVFTNTSLPVFSNANGSIGKLYGLKLGITYKINKAE